MALYTTSPRLGRILGSIPSSPTKKESMKIPTMEEVEEADHLQLCRWYRFLRSPENEETVEIINLIVNKVNALGGFTPEISKEIGW